MKETELRKVDATVLRHIYNNIFHIKDVNSILEQIKRYEYSYNSAGHWGYFYYDPSDTSVQSDRPSEIRNELNFNLIIFDQDGKGDVYGWRAEFEGFKPIVTELYSYTKMVPEHITLINIGEVY
jgi:hypothetical protein